MRRKRSLLLVVFAALFGVASWVLWHLVSEGPRHWSSGRELSLERSALEAAAAEEPSVSSALGEGATEEEAGAIEAPPVEWSAEARAEYSHPGPKSVLELQPFRRLQAIDAEDEKGRRGRAVLVELNPAVNRWFLLQLDLSDELAGLAFHLENPQPRERRLHLSESHRRGLVLEEGGLRQTCELWAGDRALLDAARSGKPFASLCSGRLYLRNPVVGRKTTLERTTDFLRDNVAFGEKITVFVRANFYADAYLETSELLTPAAGAWSRVRPEGAPARPSVDARYESHYLVPDHLGLSLESETPGKVLVGRWYEVSGNPGMLVSTMKAGLVAPDLLGAVGAHLNPLDETERAALIYMVAFDLSRFEVGFSVGTDHPRVGWSERVPDTTRDARLPGPGGFATEQPIVRVGMISPADSARTAATFTGGFKRSHGAFKWGRLSQVNGGTHYGFIEQGVVLSKPQPELATAIVYTDGSVTLKTWTSADEDDLGRIRHARQNGLPIIDHDESTGVSGPGEMVPDWSQGNWSGSQDKRLRTLRAGLCLQESEWGRFLIYGYFSAATPSGMALVFAAYGCRYAMLLDMNALEHTYLATYRIRSSEFRIQHLIEEMSVLDKSESGQYLPRFVGFPDNRDFFYLLRRAP